MDRKGYLILFIIQLICATLLFLVGFFPLKHSSNEKATVKDRPNAIGSMSIDPDFLYYPKIDKLIIMIIDALRYDMVVGDKPFMLYLANWMKTREYCLIKATAEAPTVTMPRIKALMTGNVPAYIDVALNFLQYNVTEDNLLLQARNNMLSSVFYGDETWLKIFPDMFNRSEPTHSFFVTDFTEVDLNVSRHVRKELLLDSWNVMILHYLGLDHIGHLQGPNSHLIGPKLMEMDQIISLIGEYILKKKEKSEKVVLLVGSDHGMKDTGGHGGTSAAEVTIPYVFLNQGCASSLRNDEVSQIDITPFLSALLGLPIPADSVGVLHSKMLESFEPYFSLYSIHYNTLMLYRKFQKYDPDGSVLIENSNKSVKSLLKSAEMLFKVAIENKFTGTHHIRAMKYYDKLQREMSKVIVSKGVGYGLFYIGLAVLLFIQILYCFSFDNFIKLTKKRAAIFVLLLLFAKLTDPFGLLGQRNTDGAYALLDIICSIFFYFNMCFVTSKSHCHFLLNFNIGHNHEYTVLFAIFLQAVLCGSTSFLEEEHLTWYYFFSTFLVFACVTQRNFKSIVLLVAHILLRYLNTSGVRNSNNYDIGDWFMDPENSFWQLLVYITGLYLTINWIFNHSKFTTAPYLLQKPSWLWIINRFLSIYLFTLLMLLKLYSSFIELPFVSNMVNPNFLWFGIFIGIMVGGLWWFPFGLAIAALPDFSKILHKSFLIYELDALIIGSSIVYVAICKPHNSILVPYVLHYAELIKNTCGKNSFILVIWHLGLGVLCYYYQGNSISLASIDVSSGYRTLVNPGMIVSGFLVYFHTYGLLILSFLCLFKATYILSRSHEEQNLSFGIVAFFSTFYMLYFAILVTLQRHHLFIWSVFAPKMLYISVMSLTFDVLLLIVYLLELIYTFLCICQKFTTHITSSWN